MELNGYLTKPTTRLARYPLLLEAVLKHTSDGSPDKLVLPEVIQQIRGFLSKVNQRSGEAENRFNLHQLERQLQFRPGEYVDLKLSDEQRQLVYKGALNREREELQVFLFDHAVLMVKQKGKNEIHKVYRRVRCRAHFLVRYDLIVCYIQPIPLEFLIVSGTEEQLGATLRGQSARGKTIAKVAGGGGGGSGSGTGIGGTFSTPAISIPANSKNGYPITFTHLGWRGYTITLWAPTIIARKKWLENIQRQQDAMRERSNVFETVAFSEGFFTAGNRVNCAAPFRESPSLRCVKWGMLTCLS